MDYDSFTSWLNLKLKLVYELFELNSKLVYNLFQLNSIFQVKEFNHKIVTGKSRIELQTGQW